MRHALGIHENATPICNLQKWRQTLILRYYGVTQRKCSIIKSENIPYGGMFSEDHPPRDIRFNYTTDGKIDKSSSKPWRIYAF